MPASTPIVYCVEGHWHEVDDPLAEPSVEPLLQMLQRRGLWKYVRRNAATISELFYWMNNEWNSCAYGSILYFATHGGEGYIGLGSERHLSQLTSIVHFSGCSTLACGEERIRAFMKDSGAAAVSGYCKNVGWTSRSWPPAALCDLMLLSVIRDERIDLTHRGSRKRLQNLKEELQKRFYDCGFDLYLS